jgi:DNA-binding MarR family transcriptional regulator
MSGIVADLVERGLVDKQPHPTDARASVVDLTAAGRKELTDVRRRNGALIATVVGSHPDHTDEDLATAVAVLRDVLETFDPESEDHQ